MSRLAYLALIICLLFVAVSANVDTFEADVESLHEAEIESEVAEQSTEDFLHSNDFTKGTGDNTIALATAPKAAKTPKANKPKVNKKNADRLVARDNTKHSKASAEAAEALKIASNAHKTLAEHHSKISQTKKALRKLQKQTKKLTDAANKATADATLAVKPTAKLEKELIPAAANTPISPAAPVDDAPKVGASSCTNSGAAWVNQFPTSRSTDDLVEPFRSNVNRFIADLKAAGATVSISATYRPVQRAYLMHYSSKIAKGEILASKVPPMAGVNICWNHANPKSGASAMASGYGIAYPPALVSRHTEKKAIDMTITWKKAIKIGGVTIAPGNGNNNAALNRVAANTYKIYKLANDPPHWSTDGH